MRTIRAALINCILWTNVIGDATANGVYNVMDFGAKGDGVTDDSAAIAKTYSACKSGNGGTVQFPDNHLFRTGPVQLNCNDSITSIGPGAVLMAINDTANWPFGPDCPEPAQGKTAKQMAPLLYLEYGRNVTINGGGAVDALGEMFWENACGNWWCPDGTLADPKAFRPFLFRIDYSTEVTVENIEMRNPGFWNLVPVHSSKITITDVNVSAQWSEARNKPDPFRTPNTDGFEPMWTTDVTVRGCRVKNGDDCITIKSGSSNVLVEDLYCEHGDGLTIGSVWYDDVVNVTYRRVVMNRTHNGPMIKGRSQGNATVRDITFEDILLIDVYLALTIDCVYETQGSVMKNIGVEARNITFRNIMGTVTPDGKGGGGGSTGDPSMLVDAAGTFVCLEKRPCQVFLSDISISHSNSSQTKPPLWFCNHSDITVSSAASSIHPPLSKPCLEQLSAAFTPASRTKKKKKTAAFSAAITREPELVLQDVAFDKREERRERDRERQRETERDRDVAFNNNTCSCFHCMDNTPCAPPACNVCGTANCSKPDYGCKTNATAACNCTRSWPSGEGCDYPTTPFVYAPNMPGGGCCQMPKAWMTGPHDNGGNRVEPLPYPYSSTDWGGACGWDMIRKSARFINGTCKSAGFKHKSGGCNERADCDCSTSWF